MVRRLAGLFAGTILGVFLGAALWAHAAPTRQAPPEILRAQQFQIVDREGNPRITIAVEPNGVASVRMQGKTGPAALSLEVDQDGRGAAVLFRDKKGKDRVRLEYIDNMRSGLAVLDAAEQSAISLGLAHDGMRTIMLSNGLAVEGSLMMTSGPGRQPRIVLFGDKGKERYIAP